MPYGSTLAFEKSRTLAFGSITANLVLVGSLFDYPVRTLYLLNWTDVLIDFTNQPIVNSDMTINGFTLAPYSSIVLDIMTNAPSTNAATMSKNIGIYVRATGGGGGLPTVGNVYVSGTYCRGD